MTIVNSRPIRLLHRFATRPRIGAPILNASSVADRIAQQMRVLNTMEAVYVKAKPWGFECWLVANQSTEEERFRLYDLEWQLMGATPEKGFKFHLIDRQGQSLEQVLTLEPYDAASVLREA